MRFDINNFTNNFSIRETVIERYENRKRIVIGRIIREIQIQEDSAGSKKAWDSRGRGQKDQDPQGNPQGMGGYDPQELNTPEVNQSLADALWEADKSADSAFNKLSNDPVIQNLSDHALDDLANQFNVLAKDPSSGQGTTPQDQQIYVQSNMNMTTALQSILDQRAGVQ